MTTTSSGGGTDSNRWRVLEVATLSTLAREGEIKREGENSDTLFVGVIVVGCDIAIDVAGGKTWVL